AQSAGFPASRYDFKQDRSITSDRGQVLANSGVDVACRVGGDEPPRERVKFSHFNFAATREIGMSPEIGRQKPGDDRDESEKQEFDQMLRVFDKKAVDRRIEEEYRRTPARNCRDERRHHSPVPPSPYHPHPIDESKVP